MPNPRSVVEKLADEHTAMTRLFVDGGGYVTERAALRREVVAALTELVNRAVSIAEKEMNGWGKRCVGEKIAASNIMQKLQKLGVADAQSK